MAEKITVYYVVVDCGDGSAHVEFYRNKENIEKLLDDDSEDFDESYNINEGDVSEFTVDGEITGIYFQD